MLGLISLFIVSAIIAVAIAASLHWWSWAVASTHRGTPMSYLLPFVVFMAPVIAAASLPWLIDPYGIDARTNAENARSTGGGDPVIEPRQVISAQVVCAMLAGVEWIDAGFLAKTMKLSEDELRRQTSELVAAQYIDLHAHNGRWWFGFTAVGRAAYRRSSASPAARVGEPPTEAAGRVFLTGEPVVVEVKEQRLLRQ